MDQPVQLNEGQQKALDGFFEFLFGPEKEMGITGPGGVGKTFLMGQMIDEILPQYFQTCKMMGINPAFSQVVMTATTNKAAEVLSNATQRPTETIHSFMNTTVKDDFSTGRSKISRTAAWTVHTDKIIFIDECSMIDSDLYEIIQEGTNNCKIIYVGDHCQMAPIMDSLSPVFRRGIKFYELTEPMRNSGQPALMQLCSQLRATVESGNFKPIQMVPGIIDHLTDEEMKIELHRVFEMQTLDSRILAYTNERVIQFNEHIRNMRSLPVEYTPGEYLVNNNSIQLKGCRLSVEEEIQILKLADETRFIDLGEDNKLEVRDAVIDTKFNGTLTDIPIPADRAHYLELVKYFQNRKNWVRYYELKNKYPDFRQRDAGTVYKAQGSTLDSVFIDVSNISECRNAAQVARQLYVAVSRARNRVFFYGDLAMKYGGLIL